MDTSVCFFNVPPYNQFTVTCTARAEIDGEIVPLDIIIQWTRITVSQSGSMNETNLPSTDTTATSSPNRGYQSILTTTETDTNNTITYRCRARLLDNSTSTIREISDITVTVEGLISL